MVTMSVAINKAGKSFSRYEEVCAVDSSLLMGDTLAFPGLTPQPSPKNYMETSMIIFVTP